MIDPALRQLDIASGMMIGLDQSVPDLPRVGNVTIRQAITDVVRDALLRPPCLVSFSGGRDSSTVLALALRVARTEGLDPPIAATIRFPGDADADESDFQDQLLRELGVTDRWQRTITTEFDLLGPEAIAAVQAHGLRYPVNCHFHVPMFAAAAGGSLISGVGGDELFEPHVWARTSLFGTSPRPRTADLVELFIAAAPRPVRGRMLARRGLSMPPWLTRLGREQVRRQVRAWFLEDRIPFDEHLARWWWKSRYFHHGHASLELLAGDADVMYAAPFMEPRVLSAIAGERGRRGFATRTAAMEALFGDLLPSVVLRRSTKASFSQALVGTDTRAFAAAAEPENIVDEQLVDLAALRSAWQSERIDIRSLLMLKACWRAAHPASHAPRD